MRRKQDDEIGTLDFTLFNLFWVIPQMVGRLRLMVQVYHADLISLNLQCRGNIDGAGSLAHTALIVGYGNYSHRHLEIKLTDTRVFCQ